MTFTDIQKGQLSAPLNRANVRSRQQSGRSLSYIEGWLAIAEANRIFGFDGWQSETIDIRCVAERPRKIGRDGKDGFGVSYIAKVRITVWGAEPGPEIIREGVGSGHGIDADPGLAHESAIKEAETDARKRALMTFGNPFGLALYDKDQANVADVSNEAEDTRSSSQRLADEMIAAIEETPSGEQIDRITRSPAFQRDFATLDTEDSKRVVAAAEARKAALVRAA